MLCAGVHPRSHREMRDLNNAYGTPRMPAPILIASLGFHADGVQFREFANASGQSLPRSREFSLLCAPSPSQTVRGNKVS